MKILILSFCILMATSFAHACDKDGKEKTFEDQKKASLQMVEEETAALQTAKTCLTSAPDKAAIAQCHEELRKVKEKCEKECHFCHKGKKSKPMKPNGKDEGK